MYVLNELFDSDINIKWNKRQYQWIGQFEINNIPHIIELKSHDNGKTVSLFFYIEPTWAKKNGKTPYSDTNTGKSLSVLSTVLNGLKEYIKENHPLKIIFSGDKAKKRNELYNKMIVYLANEIKKWGYSTSKEQSHSDNAVNFVLTKFEHLDEFFDTYHIKEYDEHENISSKRFTINNIPIHINFIDGVDNSDEANHNIVEIEIGIDTQPAFNNSTSIPITNIYKDSALINVLIQEISKFIENKTPYKIIFSTDDKLSHLYEIIIKRISKKFNNYSYKNNNGFILTLNETATAGSTSSGNIAISNTPMGMISRRNIGIGFDHTGDYGIYSKPTNLKKKKIKSKKV